MMCDDNMKELFSLFISLKKTLKNDDELINQETELRKLMATSILNNLILSKKIFKRNIQVGEFLKDNLKIELSKSMLHSRTMICGKITRYISDLNDDDELNIILNVLYRSMKKIIKETDILKKDVYEIIEGMNV